MDCSTIVCEHKAYKAYNYECLACKYARWQDAREKQKMSDQKDL